MAYPKMTSSAPMTSDLTTWQTEMKQLHNNYFLIGMLLEESSVLSRETRLTFQYLKRELISTLEQFNDELEQPKDYFMSTQIIIFKKHVNIMRRLNKAVESMVKKHSYCS